jgi:hypothetical protein
LEDKKTETCQLAFENVVYLVIATRELDPPTRLQQNLARNYAGDECDYDPNRSHGSVPTFPLAWSSSDYSRHGTFDVVVMGADVVASLYDPVALLAKIIWSVAPHSRSIVVYVSFKERPVAAVSTDALKRSCSRSMKAALWKSGSE